MRKKLMLSVAFAAALLAGPAFATGNHAGGHDEMAVGKPGDAGHVDRTVRIGIKETDDGRMLFEPSEFSAKKGETIRIVVVNSGQIDHEFVMDDAAKNAEHKALMEKFPEMEHDDPNAVRLAPGEEGEIVWTFTKAGEFEFACLIPGHYESGMHGPLTVAGK
ncbi:cupredoxin domain-containing protein [Antarcticirhabdus aurantiaca]|uniref:Cupredoxin family protein n=1 Tax=Antarcticirhabdus aurantiaca TaxID=2606717 RepID=A0ACD4NXQ7_9HYPH|nr:cupredoxin family protein [Antarcticirhabdus aurantiaca]WAJ31234.1 cupredoxin family protein [Jeongeuplla avenae]